MSLVAMIARADDRGLATTGLACLDRCVPLVGGDDETLRPLWTSLADGDGWPERLAAARAALGPAAGADGSPDAPAAGAAPVAGAVRVGGPRPAQDGCAPGEGTAGAPAAGEEARALVLRMLGTAPATLPGDLAATATATATATAAVAATAPATGTAAGPAPEHRPLDAWADACSLASLHVHALLDPVGDAPEAVAAYREGRTDGISPLAAAELRSQAEILHLLAEHGAGALRQALEISTEGRRILRAAVSRQARARCLPCLLRRGGDARPCRGRGHVRSLGRVTVADSVRFHAGAPVR